MEFTGLHIDLVLCGNCLPPPVSDNGGIVQLILSEKQISLGCVPHSAWPSLISSCRYYAYKFLLWLFHILSQEYRLLELAVVTFLQLCKQLLNAGGGWSGDVDKTCVLVD